MIKVIVDLLSNGIHSIRFSKNRKGKFIAQVFTDDDKLIEFEFADLVASEFKRRVKKGIKEKANE